MESLMKRMNIIFSIILLSSMQSKAMEKASEKAVITTVATKKNTIATLKKNIQTYTSLYFEYPGSRPTTPRDLQSPYRHCTSPVLFDHPGTRN